ncbi:MAG: SDR family NAD(P)-dependent oxidoreductase [bacterium]|nr:short-chain dehydrogenase [Deltaproteobacteria bacterium]MCP4904439.1 SDR family NAD(P)-dependent oxidoreductase [bacterium]
MDLQLEGKVALVTGGSRGIGLAIGHSLAAEGVKVVVAARTQSDVDQAAQEIEAQHGAQTLGVVADVKSAEDVERAVESSASAFGGVDILVSNAGVPGGIGFGPLETLDDSLVLMDIETKFLGALRAARAVAPHMKKNGWGRIIGVIGLSARYSSRYPSERNPEGAFNYSGGPRNLAVAHLMRTLSHELGDAGVTANAVLPGATMTEDLAAMIDRRAKATGQDPAELRRLAASGNAIGRWVESSEVADVVTFVASPRAASISGEVIAASGGAGMGVFT